MTGHEYRNPFGYVQAHVKIISSGNTDTQIARMPWQTPVSKPGILRKVILTNASSVGGYVKLWDEDASNATPPTTGSAGAALFSLYVSASGAGATTIYTEENLPEYYFIGGINSQASTYGVTVMAEVEYI